MHEETGRIVDGFAGGNFVTSSVYGQMSSVATSSAKGATMRYKRRSSPSEQTCWFERLYACGRDIFALNKFNFYLLIRLFV